MTARIAILIGATLLVAGTALALDPNVKCQAGKNKEAGKYAYCRQKAEAIARRKGLAPDYTRCADEFFYKWQSAEDRVARKGATCPDGISDPNTMADFIADHCDAVAAALGGDGLPTYLEPGVDPILLVTGQATCWQNALAVPCANTGQDGEHQVGARLSYVDNQDGTISDLNTGLMWEKKSDDAGLHDKDDWYDWRGTCTGDGATECWIDADCSAAGGTCMATSVDGSADTVFEWLAKVNAEGPTGFAGYSDWRVPNVRELQSIIDYDRTDPAVDTVFHTACTSGCTVTTCSCTFSSDYWSSTSTVAATNPAFAWLVDFEDGGVNANRKTTNYYFVRAVRGGL